MAEDQKARMRRNRSRIWYYAAVAAAQSVAAVTNVQYDFAGGSIDVTPTNADFISTTAASGIPFLTVDKPDLGLSINFKHWTASFTAGTASANRRIIAAFTFGDIYGASMLGKKIVAASIGGVAATILYDGSSSASTATAAFVSFFYADVPSGSVLSMTVSWSAALDPARLGFVTVFSCDKSLFANPSPTVVYDNQFDLPSRVTITASANAVMIAIAQNMSSVPYSNTISLASAPAGWTNTLNRQPLKAYYANSVTANTYVFESYGITVTAANAVAVLVWR